MAGNGLIENVNLSGIEFNGNGDSVTLHLVGMVPPFQNSRFECYNIYCFNLHRPTDEQIPYYVGELSWRELGDSEKQIALEKAGYSFFDHGGEFFDFKTKIFSVHMEGGAWADILAERVMVIETTNIGEKP